MASAGCGRTSGPLLRFIWFSWLAITAGLLPGCDQHRHNLTAQAQATAQPEQAPPTRCAILPGGLELEFEEHGAERQLIDLLNDPAAASRPMPWMALVSAGAEFDFPGGSAAQAQLGNIASILRAYPRIRIIIAGVARGAPQPHENVRASLHAAIAVLSRLSKLGVDPERMVSQGLGDQDPAPQLAVEAGRKVLLQVAAR